MKIIDTHCDALYKLQDAKWKGINLDLQRAEALDTNLGRLNQGNVQIQFFAMFLEPDIPSEKLWFSALEQIELFHQEILEKNPQIKHIKSWQDIDHLHDGEIGAVLTFDVAEQ